MSDCSNVPLLLEVIAPAPGGKDVLNDVLCCTAGNWASKYRDVITKLLCDFCSGVSFYIENIGGRDHVVVRTAVRRGNVDVVVGIIKDALAMIGVDLKQLVVRTFDPCNHKTFDEWLDVCWSAFNERRRCEDECYDKIKERSERFRCYDECEEKVIKELMSKYGMSRGTAEFCVNIGYCD